MIDRVALLVEKGHLSPDEARTTAKILTGLSDTAFTFHVDCLSKQEKGKGTATTPSTPPAMDNVQSQVIDWMSQYLNSENPEAYTQSVPPPVDDLSGVGQDIATYFAQAEIDADEE